MKHANVALFVPHIGCPHACSFCNQRTISGETDAPAPSDVKRACEIAVKSQKCNPEESEIAFFGGSFTAIERDYMRALLAAALPYIKGGFFRGVRISTRPDCIDREILSELKAYGVTTVELGAQSMSDSVLQANLRGHTADDVRRASALIRKAGFSLGLQMMTGLYKSTDESDLQTAEELIKLSPDCVRIYPTVVLRGTRLAALYKSGEYVPQTLEAAVLLCAKLLTAFHEAEIPVIRLGLHSGGNVEEGYLAGAYHPAFRELCEGEIYLQKMLEKLQGLKTDRDYLIEVSEKSLSKAKGQQKRNEKALRNSGFRCTIKGNLFLNDYEIQIKELGYDFKVAGDAGV